MNGITGLILAGGLARRMGGADKGLQPFRGRPMIAHVIARLAPQVNAIIINANRNRDTYAALGYPVVADAIEGFAGPLAGLHAGLCACTTPLLATSPCDSPFLPVDLVARLHAALMRADAQVAVAQSGGRAQPVFTLCRRNVLDNLTTFLDGGGRKVDTWYVGLKVVDVTFPDQAAFANINTPEELERLETK
ncbi:MAG: molybdenum cofactor guanylyltransferase MobA [Sterolibacterium sp.]